MTDAISLDLPTWITEDIETALVAAMQDHLDALPPSPDFDEGWWAEWLWLRPEAPEDGEHTPALSAWLADLWNDTIDGLDQDARAALWPATDDDDAAYERWRDAAIEGGHNDGAN